MATTTTTTTQSETRSILSFHNDLWQMSWGETAAIAALREEMAQGVQQGSWQHRPQPQNQPQALSAASQLPALQPVGFIMTMVPAAQCQLPMVMLSAQPTPLASIGAYKNFQPENRQGANTCHSSSTVVLHSARPSADSDSLKDHADPAANGMTREDFEGELPSVGSEGHFDGSCKRCAFFPKGRCSNGKDCTHCHFPHEPRSRLRKRCALRAQKDVSQEVAADDVMPEPEEAPGKTGALAEVSYLAEPVPVADKKQVAHQCKSNADVDVVTSASKVSAKDKHGEAAIKSFNIALEEIAAAFMSPQIKEKNVETASLDSHDDGDDVDTTPSISALCDGEDTPTMSCSMSENSEASDSEMSPPKSTASPNSWSSMQRNRKAGNNGPLDIARMTRALLNKLTEQRFESLCSQILALPLATPEQLAAVVAEIFEKATTQDGFRKLYTELCMRLDTHLAAQAGAIGGKAFRKALVNECQATFERNLQPPVASLFKDLDVDERFELEMKLKNQRLGNMRFIGDLLVKKLLAPKLLPPIVHELLNGSEATLEALVALLAVVSPQFEARPSIYQAPLRDAFAVLGRKMKEKTVSSRVGCQINDLLDAKARGWAPRSISC